MFEQITRFLGAGVVATGAQYIVLILLVELASFNTVVASALGYTTGAVINYLQNYYHTFRSTEPHAGAIIRFTVVASIGLLLNSAIMFLLAKLLGVQYIVAQIIATGTVLVWNFIAHRSWTYKAAQ